MHLQVRFVVSRAKYWFWDSVVLWQTLTLASAQVLAVSLNAYFQLTIMLTLLVSSPVPLAPLQSCTVPNCRLRTES